MSHRKRQLILDALSAPGTDYIEYDRKDAPTLPVALQMADEGVLVSEFVQYDEQSSALRFRLAREDS